MPCDSRAHLGAVEAEGFEEGEFVSAAAYRGDERVTYREESQAGEEHGEDRGQPVDAA